LANVTWLINFLNFFVVFSLESLYLNTITKTPYQKCMHIINFQKSERKQFHLLLGNVLNLLIQDEKIQNFKEILFNIGMDLLCHVPKESWYTQKII
jgi:hypothetical protein